MVRIDIRQVPKKYKESVILKRYGSIAITKQKTGYGYKRFFLCPWCGNRVQYLYLCNEATIKCRHCLPYRVYKNRTDVYPGGEQHLANLMCKIACENNIRFDFPFDYVSIFFKRPKYMRHKKWERILRQLQTLENMRFMIIISKGTIDIKVIKYYLNKGLYDFTLTELKNRLIVWSYPARILNVDPFESGMTKI